MATQIKVRRGTSSQWSTINPTLAEGEIGFELDTNKLKVGDGITSWANLEYLVAETDLSEYLTIASASTTYALKDNPNISGTISLGNNSSIGPNNGGLYISSSLVALDYSTNVSLPSNTYIGGLFNSNNLTATHGWVDSEYLSKQSASSTYAKSVIEVIERTGTLNDFILDHKDKLIKINNSSANSFFVPKNADAAFPIGAQVSITQTGTGQTTITADTMVTLRTSSGLKLRTQYSSASLIKINTDEWLVSGDLTT